MKIRNYLPLLICLSFAVLSGCKKDEPAKLTLLTSSISVENTGGRQEIGLLTNQNWFVRKPVDWIAVLPDSGEASDSYQIITVLVAENPSEDERSAELTVIAGEKSATVSIKQAGKPAAPRMTISAFRNKKADETLEDYLDKRVFASAKIETLMADKADIEGFSAFLEDYKKALAVDKAAVDSVG